ncbi:hypothetical protein [Nocardiopsis ansamitocini]|uniref:hypothetical protein n=1 Tax=Nocardiopsis ansamitocini TaxID=1670832 RepID=UPI0025564DDB|nr:hypothetical protein [Nocardiopsis ansamitocini]
MSSPSLRSRHRARRPDRTRSWAYSPAGAGPGAAVIAAGFLAAHAWARTVAAMMRPPREGQG